MAQSWSFAVLNFLNEAAKTKVALSGQHGQHAKHVAQILHSPSDYGKLQLVDGDLCH